MASALAATALALLLLSGLLAGCTNPLDQIQGDRTGPGQRAADYLRAQPYTRIRVELDAVQGQDPDASALALLERRFETVTGKPVDVIRSDTFAGLGRSHKYTSEEIARFEREHRDEYTGGSTAVLHLMFLDGGFQDDTEERKVLGAAYRGSSVVMFKDNLRDASHQGGLVRTKPPLREVEESVLVHELGHILGLVNHGTPMVRNHEDPEHPGHSSNRDSVMYWAVETSAIGSLLGQTPPDDFDSNDKADMNAMRNA